jgi:hypothetical protein
VRGLERFIQLLRIHSTAAVVASMLNEYLGAARFMTWLAEALHTRP